VLVHPSYALITGHLPWHKKNEAGPPKRHLMHVKRCLTRCKVPPYDKIRGRKLGEKKDMVPSWLLSSKTQ